MSVLKHRHNGHTARHSVPAWPGRPDADEPISFDDIASLPDPDWIGRSPLAGLALDAELLEPLELTDWSYWLNRQFGNAADRNATPNSIEAQFRALATDVNFTLYGIAKDAALPSLAIADFVAELDDDRGAMLADINAERVLLAELAPVVAMLKGLVA